jgi:SAM-dependent methyltransferase
VIVDKILLEHVPCDLCKQSNYKVRYRKPDDWLWLNQFEFPVVECLSCELVYVNPRPDVQSMSKYYPIDYHDGRSTEGHKERYEMQLDYLPGLDAQVVLDIGCARGDFLNYLQNRYPGITTYGVDLFSAGVNFKQIRFLKSDLLDCKFDAEKFDIVTSWAVFEHLHTPSLYFEEVARILKPKGKFIFLVTNSESLYGRRAMKEDVPRHTYHYSEKTLKVYATKFGFKMNTCSYENRFWDGTGKGAFKFLFQGLVGVTWNQRQTKDFNLIQKIATRIGRVLDRVVFTKDWEVRTRRSGIIVLEFEKL